MIVNFLESTTNNRWYATKSVNHLSRPCGYCVVQALDFGEGLVVEKQHDDGHETLDGAISCYLEFLLDTAVKEPVGANYTCIIEDCGKLAEGIGIVADAFCLSLCEEHRTEDIIKEQFSARLTQNDTYEKENPKEKVRTPA